MSGERDAPVFTVKVQPEGKAATRLDLSDKVLSFAFEDHEKKADKLTITVDNFDLANFDDPTWAKGNLLEVSWGYAGQTAPARQMVIKSVKGFQVLTVVAHAKSVLMDRQVRSRMFENVTRAQVVRRVAGEHGYSGADLDVEDTNTVHAHIAQARMTDAQFLRKLALRQGFEFYVDATGLHWHARRLGQKPKRTLIWYTDPGQGDVLSIDVENDVTAKPGEVVVKGRDPLAKKAIEAKADNTEKRTTLAPVLEVVDPRTGKTSLQSRAATGDVRPTSEATPAAAKAQARGKYLGAQQTTVKMTVTMVGDPRLEAKTVVDVQGVGKRLSGLYYVHTAKHSIASGGYTTELHLRRDGHGGYGAAKNVKAGGNVNTQKASDGAALTPVEVVDARTGQTRIEYRRSQPTGGTKA